MSPWLTLAIVVLTGYLVGAVPFGVLVARWRGVDLLSQGSGNIGATNVGRVLGRRFGILVFVLDFAKGAVPVGLTMLLSRAESPTPSFPPFGGGGWLEVACGLAAFLGHLFPVYLGFRGGKGVATGAGVVAVLVPGPALLAFFAWVAVTAATRYVSLASLTAVIVLCLAQLGDRPEWSDPRTLFCLLAALLVFVRHRSNIVRLAQGTENRLQESSTMLLLTRSVHLLALGLWFGTTTFFSFVVALSLFNTFETLGQQTADQRPPWFPLPATFEKKDDAITGPKEQGSRAAAYAVGPMFHWYFLVQGICGFLALGTALAWAKLPAHAQVHRLRANLVLAALVTVLLGWPLERKVSELRVPRNAATDAYLQASPASAGNQLTAMKEARADFGRWHLYSLLLNFGTIVLVCVALALAAKLPQEGATDETQMKHG